MSEREDTPRFRRSQDGRARLWIEEGFADELEPLGLLEDDAFEAFCAGGSPVPGGRGAGYRVPLASGRAVHVRELAHGGALRHLTGRRFLSTRRASAALLAAGELRRRGVPLPAPVAFRGRRRGPFWHLTLCNAFVEPARAGGSFLEAAEPRERALAARRAGAAVRVLHDAGGRHRDLHVDNLLVAEGRDGPAIWIVDPDGVRVGAPPAVASRRRQLLRLLRSLRKRELDARERARCVRAFLRGYLGDDAALGRALLRGRRPGAGRS